MTSKMVTSLRTNRRAVLRLKQTLFFVAIFAFIFGSYILVELQSTYGNMDRRNNAGYHNGFTDARDLSVSPEKHITQVAEKKSAALPKDYKVSESEAESCSPPLSLVIDNQDVHNQLQLRCDGENSTFYVDFMYETTVPSVNFQDPCLSNAIRNFCPRRGLKVPNIIHYVWFNMKNMTFFHFVSFVSAHKFQIPCLILVHGDVPGGSYWDSLVNHVPYIIHVSMAAPYSIGGQKIGSVEHKSDLARIMILKEYGGIYLDTDTVLLQSLDPLRNHSVTMSLEYWSNLSNGLILSSPDAIFIRHWLSRYQDYHFDPHHYWEYSLFLPTRIAKSHPEWIHIENMTFCKPSGDNRDQIFKGDYDWSENFAIHLYIRYYKQEHNFVDIRKLKTTIGSVARHVLYGTRHLCND